MITHVHHINFLVHDLERGVEKYSALLGGNGRADCRFIYDDLKARGVKIARTKLGETWLVLVQPVDQQSEPARHLKKHGEGFFLMSLACDDLNKEATRIGDETELCFSSSPRQGLDNWRVRDLHPDDFNNVQIQLTEEEVKP